MEMMVIICIREPYNDKVGENKNQGGSRLDKKKKQDSMSIEEYLQKRKKLQGEQKDRESASHCPGSVLFFSGIVGGFLL